MSGDPAAAEGAIGFGARLRRLAAARGAAPAVTVLSREGAVRRTSWEALDRGVDLHAAAMAARGVAPGGVVGVGLGNGLDHILCVLAAWRLGATVLPFDPAIPAAQRDGVLHRAAAALAVVAREPAETGARLVSAARLAAEASEAPHRQVPEAIPHPGKIILSGGSTGLPKMMAEDQPWTRRPGRSWGNVAPRLGFRPGQVQLVCASMSHNAGLTWAQIGLFEGQHLVVMEHFDAAAALRAIDDHGVNFVMLVPTMMVRMLDLQDRAPARLTTLEALYHTAAPCAEWLKRRWIGILGAARVFEMYGSGEGAGQTIISGEEWLGHPGSVGRPFETEIRIRDAEGRALGPGETGELFMRPWDLAGMTRYLDPGRSPRRDAEGFTSVGDMARVDAEGYVYLAGRRDDVIITGGLKVHPERVEAVLLSHPLVRDVVVFGLTDRDWGERVHAAVEAAEAGAVELAALHAHCGEALLRHELPRSLSLHDALPRDGFGKIRRRALRAGLEADAPPA